MTGKSPAKRNYPLPASRGKTTPKKEFCAIAEVSDGPNKKNFPLATQLPGRLQLTAPRTPTKILRDERIISPSAAPHSNDSGECNAIRLKERRGVRSTPSPRSMICHRYWPFGISQFDSAKLDAQHSSHPRINTTDSQIGCRITN
jgi:hypothetical protein